VLLAVFGGFVLQDGHLAALFQPYELLMIFGGALGAFVIGNDRKALSLTWHSMPNCSTARATPGSCTCR
jgi:chemotaxis protein MotA